MRKLLWIVLVLLVLAMNCGSQERTDIGEYLRTHNQPELAETDELTDAQAAFIVSQAENMQPSDVGSSRPALGVTSQRYLVFTVDGWELETQVECSHSGCRGQDCVTSGCIPTANTLNCTAANCTGEDGCNIQRPTCSKKVTSVSE